MADMTFEEYQAYLDQLEREASGGGGIVCRATYSPGYKAFVGGYVGEEQAKTWFPYEVCEPGSKEQALSKCRVFINESGSDTQAQLCYGFQLHLSSVKARTVGWQGDRYLMYPLWQDAATQVVRPAMDAIRLFPGDFWARWAWTDDPSGYMETDQNGEERVRQVAYPAERYKDEAEAETAAQGIAESFNGNSPVNPPEWLKAEVKRLTEMAGGGASASALAGQLGVEKSVAQVFIDGGQNVRKEVLASALGQEETLVAAALVAAAR